MVKTKKITQEKLRLRIKAYDAKIIDSSVRQIIEVITSKGGQIIGPIPLPTEIKKYTVNRSTFIYKKSREQFELRVHKRLLDIVSPNPAIIQALTDLNLPAGVDVEIKMVS